ncbi:MAG: S1C family serine protease [Treponema sp.]|jgi:S1-C subfamily serine protease|nr:S1C family serine protease [Treponema sp.]
MKTVKKDFFKSFSQNANLRFDVGFGKSSKSKDLLYTAPKAAFPKAKVLGKHPNIIFFVLPVFIFFTSISCNTQAAAGRRLEPPKSVKDFRLDDIAKHSSEDPSNAIHLIEVYRALYGPGSVYPDGEDPEVKARLRELWEEAAANLKIAQEKAIKEQRWTDAASLARSLSNLDISVESTGEEPELVLAYAKQQLEKGNNLAAFLAAVRSHNLKPLEAADALVFLEKAVAVKQRRTAAFFLGTIADQDEIDRELKSYAQGRDSATEMIKGVATVWIDRGYRIERGRGIPDRVLGSAFFVDSTGLLITNYHVISSEVDPKYEGYSRMFIRMGDSASARIPAKVIGWDKAMDLALIKAELIPEYVYSVIDRIIPQVGDTVYAIGSPGGLEKTVTQGIVSALGRRFLQIGDVIQIDAAVNQGNSGGPVVDMNGRLVGIVFAGIEAFPGINFAVPAERLAAALPAMIDGGKAERPWLGVSISETSSAEGGGAEIIYTAPSTPAAEQQIREGLVIRSINGKELNTVQGALIPALQDLLFPLKPGELVRVVFSNADRTLEISRIIRITPRPDVPLAEAAKMDSRERMAAPLFGLVLTPSSGGSFFPSYQVRKVIRGSAADEAGLSENDPVTLRGFRVMEKDGIALLEINVKKRRMGYMETTMQLPALLDSPDTL